MAKPGSGSIFLLVPRTPERALVISSALTVVSFLCHIFFLFLVDPWKVIPISKEDALAYSTIPLGFGVVFFAASIYSFIKIDLRSMVHVVLLIFAAGFGSFSFHGILGFVHHYLNLAVLASYPR